MVGPDTAANVMLSGTWLGDLSLTDADCTDLVVPAGEAATKLETIFPSCVVVVCGRCR